MEEVTVVEVDSQLVVGMRKRGRYQEMATMIPQLCRYAAENGAQFRGRPTFVCHEKSVEEARKADQEGNADVEVAVPIAEEVDGTDEIKCYELPGGKMARIVHKGPYEECESAYETLFAWLGENGKTLVGPIREVYLNDPNEVPPAEILTEIYAPIE
jgi:effector-binding domain-containing protein